VLDAAHIKNFALHGPDVAHADLWPSERLWQLTNTRYLIGIGGMVSALNQYADRGHTFEVKTFLKMAPKPDVPSYEDIGDLTAYPDPQGPYALIEFHDPLPRAKLYSSWQSPTNDEAALQLLASHDFDPTQTLLVASDTPVGQASGDPKSDAGTVDITDYHPKIVKLDADVKAPAVLLFNDRVSPAWKAYVDKKPAPMLRCNYIMRGVYLTPGEHLVEFRYQAPNTSLYVSLCAWAAGVLTAGYLACTKKPAVAISQTQAQASPSPAPAAPAKSVPAAPVTPPPPRKAPVPGRGKQRRR
jgi:hypothetical protein